jgi:pimeloyl-ACP methyl ester carboxylesterase
MPRRTGPAAVAELADVPLPDFDPIGPPWPGRTESIAGASVFVRHTPSTSAHGQPAVYVHGLAGSSTNWTDLAALLAPWLDATALDLPGFGRSGPAPGGAYSIAAAARVVIGHIEQSDRGPVHLLGNSMGGAVSITVAVSRPDLVRTLTLISPAVPDLRLVRPTADPLIGLLLVPGPASNLVERRLSLLPVRTRVLGTLRLCFADVDRLPPERLEQAVEELTERRGQPWTTTAFTRSLRGLVRHWLAVGPMSAWRELTKIHAPSLVVWGDRDKLVDVRLAPRVARAIPDCRLLVLNDVGHTAQMEEPRLTARAILGLLRAPDAR